MQSLMFVLSLVYGLTPVTDTLFCICQYKDVDMIKKVKDAAGNKISHVFDTIAGKDTQHAAVKVLAEDKPGKVVTVLPLVEGIKDVRKDVEVTSPSSRILKSPVRF